MTYDPRNHYWIVGGDKSRVFASERGVFVRADDATYQAWLSSDRQPTRIASVAELGEVLSNARVRPSDVDVLDGYKDEQSRKVTLETMAKVLHLLVNEVRALKGQSALSAAQFRAFIKDQV